jgi:hypothetical protein
MENALLNDTTLTFLATAVTAAWTLFKTSDWWQQHRQRRFDRALHVLETAVEETYRAYVERIKEARADGKLTPGERRRARELARHRAITIGRTQGIDILQELGGEYFDLWIARLVKKLKQ